MCVSECVSKMFVLCPCEVFMTFYLGWFPEFVEGQMESDPPTSENIYCGTEGKTPD